MKRQVISGEEGDQFSSWSIIYREGDKVIFHYNDYDREDRRAYDYVGTFSVKAYNKALKDLQKDYEVELVSNGDRLKMTLKEGVVYMRLDSSVSHSTPGGASVSAIASFSCKLNEMFLKE